MRRLLCLAVAALGLSGSACKKDPIEGRTEARDAAVQASDARAGDGGTPRRCTRNSPEREPYFGDLHVHTALSLDANLQGTRLRPVDAYRFARGEEVGLPPYDETGKPLRTRKLERPLDFVALSDHAEFLGLVNTCQDEDAPGYDA